MGACHTSGMACPFRSSETISTIDSAVSRPSRLSGNHIAVGREKGIEMADRQFAVYSVDDESLTFYRYGRIPVLGTEFAGKHVTKVFENFNDHCWTTDAIADRVTGVSVADGGIKPRKLCHWFNRFKNLCAADLEKLDTTCTTAAQGLFESCGNLEQVRMPRNNAKMQSIGTIFLIGQLLKRDVLQDRASGWIIS